MTTTTIDDTELQHFAKMAEDWWNPTGKLMPLHRINPLRLSYIRDHMLTHFGLNGAERYPFKDLAVLDIGCGGGLLSEPMARLGAKVTGADATKENIGIAKAHATQTGLDIDYRTTTSEALAEAGETFDVVLAMEIIEHVADVPLFVQSCTRLVKPGGMMFISTINRTARAFALAIVGAEYVLNWLPKGSHSYQKFLTPDEVTTLVTRNGLTVRDKAGVSFAPLHNEWRKSRDLGVNYMMVMEKPATGEKS